MIIQPPSSGQTPKPGPGRLGQTAATRAPNKDAQSAPDAETTRTDRVELSAAALELQGQLGVEKTPVHELPPDRLREIGERVAGGFYEQPGVKDVVVRLVARDLERHPG